MNATLPYTGPTGLQDRTSKVLIWILLIVAVLCGAGMVWATKTTYDQVAPLPQQMVGQHGQIVMRRADIVAGKAGFQRADLMDYGSLYGMGSYFGEDYTAAYLVQLAHKVQDNLAQLRHGKPFAALDAEQQFGITHAMRKELQGIDLSQARVQLPDTVADALVSIAPPVGRWEFETIALPDCPWLIVQGEEDEVVEPQAVFDWVDALPQRPELVRMPETSHFFHRRLMDLRGAIKHAVRSWLPPARAS